MKKFILSIALLMQALPELHAQNNVLISPALSDLMGDYKTFFYQNNKASRLIRKSGGYVVESFDNEKFKPTKEKRTVASPKPPKDGASVSIIKDYYCGEHFNFNNKTYLQFYNRNLNQRNDLYLMSLTKEGFKDESLAKVEFNKNATSSLERKFASDDYSAAQGQSVFQGFNFKTSANGKFVAAFSHSRIFTSVTASVKYYDVEPYDVCIYDRDMKLVGSNTFSFRYEIKMSNIVLGEDGQNIYLLKTTKRDSKDSDYDILFYQLPIVSQKEDIKPVTIDLEDKIILTCRLNTAPDGTIFITGSYTNKLKSIELKNVADGTFTMAYNATTNSFSQPQYYTFEGEFKKYFTSKVTKGNSSFYELNKITQASDGTYYIISSIGVTKEYTDNTKAILVTCLDRNRQHVWSTPVVHEMTEAGGLSISKEIAVRYNDNELEVILNDNKQNYDSDSKQCKATFADSEPLKSSNCVASIKYDRSSGLPKRRMLAEAKKIYYRFSTAIWSEDQISLACEGNVGYTVSICKLSLPK